MTVKEVLEVTVGILAGVNVPVALLQQIGEPIAAAIGNLNACIDGMNQAEVKANGNDADAG